MQEQERYETMVIAAPRPASRSATTSSDRAGHS